MLAERGLGSLNNLVPLKLEYICTEAEMREAQSLHLRRPVGGGFWGAAALFFLFHFGHNCRRWP